MLGKLILGRFEETRQSSGEVLKYRIETVSPELTELIVNHMVQYFLKREPLSDYDDLLNEEKSLNSFIKLWRETLKTGTPMVALEERDDEVVNIVGVNITLILQKDKQEDKEFEGDVFNKVVKAMNIITDKANLYERYKVDKYLSAFGLSVNADYHGFKIGYRLLSCREPLCKALGLQATGTVFSSKAAQYSAAKAGFEILAEEDYDKFEIDGQVAYAGLEGSLVYMGRKYSFGM